MSILSDPDAQARIDEARRAVADGDVLMSGNCVVWRHYDDLPQFQFGIYDDDTDELLAEGHTSPCW